MKKYVCKVCGYVYDPANNNGVAFFLPRLASLRPL